MQAYSARGTLLAMVILYLVFNVDAMRWNVNNI